MQKMLAVWDGMHEHVLLETPAYPERRLIRKAFALTLHRWKAPDGDQGVWNTRFLLQLPGETWELGGDPVTEGEVTAARVQMEVEPPEGKWLDFQGQIEAGMMRPVEPDGHYPKKLPIYVDILDEGQVNVTEESPHGMLMDFDGADLKGEHALQVREDGTDAWKFIGTDAEDKRKKNG
jgi:hypothetical protein